MPILYLTDNMEHAIHKMAARNKCCLIIKKHRTLKPIRARLDKLRDLPVYKYDPLIVPVWQGKGGLMIYCPSRKRVTPQADAAFIIECPLQADEYDSLAPSIANEIIIFRPPTWKLHDDTVNAKFLSSNAIETMRGVIGGFVGRRTNEPMQWALEKSGFDPEITAVFTARDVTNVTGFTRQQVDYLFRHVGHNKHRKCIDVMLNGFGHQEAFYLVEHVGSDASLIRHDALNGIKLADWIRMKSMVDGALEY